MINRYGWILIGFMLSGLAQAATVQVSVQGPDAQPLEDAVVYLESETAARQLQPLPEVAIIQQDKTFIPDVTVVTKGTAVAFPNQDSVRHHVYSFSPIKKFDIKLYAGTPEKPVVFEQPGIAVLGCNIHDQMVAWVVVLNTPYFARTDAKGQVKLEAPAGNYRLRVWHKAWKEGREALDRPLSLSAGGSMTSLRITEF